MDKLSLIGLIIGLVTSKMLGLSYEASIFWGCLGLSLANILKLIYEYSKNTFFYSQVEKLLKEHKINVNTLSPQLKTQIEKVQKKSFDQDETAYICTGRILGLIEFDKMKKEHEAKKKEAEEARAQLEKLNKKRKKKKAA